MTGNLVELGVIVGAKGIKGEVKIRSFTRFPEDLVSYGTLQDKSGNEYVIHIRSVVKDQVTASIAGVCDRNKAEKLRSTSLFVERSKLPPAEEDEYYHNDLIGLPVYLEDDTPFGTFISIHNYGAGDIVTVKTLSGEEELFPFTKAIFPVIYIKQQKITLSLPEKIIAEEDPDGYPTHP